MVYGVEQLTWIARIIANVASYHYWGGVGHWIWVEAFLLKIIRKTEISYGSSCGWSELQCKHLSVTQMVLHILPGFYLIFSAWEHLQMCTCTQLVTTCIYWKTCNHIFRYNTIKLKYLKRGRQTRPCIKKFFCLHVLTDTAVKKKQNNTLECCHGHILHNPVERLYRLYCVRCFMQRHKLTIWSHIFGNVQIWELLKMTEGSHPQQKAVAIAILATQIFSNINWKIVLARNLWNIITL